MKQGQKLRDLKDPIIKRGKSSRDFSDERLRVIKLKCCVNKIFFPFFSFKETLMEQTEENNNSTKTSDSDQASLSPKM